MQNQVINFPKKNKVNSNPVFPNSSKSRFELIKPLEVSPAEQEPPFECPPLDTPMEFIRALFSVFRATPVLTLFHLLVIIAAFAVVFFSAESFFKAIKADGQRNG